MGREDDYLNFKKSVNEFNSDENSSENSQNLDNAKLKIMNKYGVSSKEADKILLKIIQLEETNLNYGSKAVDSSDNSSKNKSVVGKNKLNEYNGDSNIIAHYQDSNKNYEPNVELTEEKLSSSQSTEIENTFNNFVSKDEDLNNDSTQSDQYSKNDVDSILTDIIPNYNQQVSIELKHVDLTFEVQTEIIDNLKESFIRKIKHKTPKIMEIKALKDISFKIFQGEKVGIIGYNGAGKSTLLNVISGIYPPDNGTVKTFGRISPLLALGAGFDGNFSGRRNILLNGAILGFDKEFLKSKIDEIIEFSELGEFIEIPIKNYSSGMLAKLGFSIVTAVNPDILIIDEILGVGDVNFQKKSSDKIRSLMDGGTTVILVSHSIPAIRELCDKAIWLDNGELKAIGEVNKVCDCYLKDAEKATNEQLANIQFR